MQSLPNNEIPNYIQHFPLEYLNISGCECTELPNWIYEMESLQELDISHLSLEEFPFELNKMSFLRVLNICYCVNQDNFEDWSEQQRASADFGERLKSALPECRVEW